jgi:hypothetical protein
MGVVTAWALTAPLAGAAEQTMRTVQGEVVAVNVQDSPNVIVVKTVTAKKQEMIVGAVVESGAVITRGKEKVGLDNLQVGETVSLTYSKSQDGLVARSIQVKGKK